MACKCGLVFEGIECGLLFNIWMNIHTYTSKPSIDVILFFAVIAAGTVANIVKSSLGPVGLDKMIVDDVGVSFRTVHLYSGCLRWFLNGQ